MLPLFIENIMGHELSNSRSIVDLKIFSVACFPLLVNQQLQGVLYLGSSTPGKSLQKSQMPIMNIFSAQAALILASALRLSRAEHEAHALSNLLAVSRSGMMVGTSPIMEKNFSRLLKIALTDLSALVRGETGTGKELFAREIHLQSARSGKPFIAINCAAIPENLLESVLFGHKKGSFTGAISDGIGKFEAAHGGTIFLDEIGEMPQSLQVKLLRVLQERVVTRIGEHQERPIDVRIISATHQNLEKLISEKRFREDLYYRLNEVSFEIPPLRERKEDIGSLANHFLKSHAKDRNLSLSTLSIESLLQYPWPGNIRELHNVIKRTAALTDRNMIEPGDLEIPKAGLERENIPNLFGGQSLDDAWRAFAREKIKTAIEKAGGNKTQAAKLLGITPRTLFRYLEGEELEC